MLTKVVSNADIVKQHLQSRKDKSITEAKLTALNESKLARENANKTNVVLENMSRNAVNRNKRLDFSTSVSNYLMETAIYTIFEKVLEESGGDNRDMNIGRNTIRNFVQEEGYAKLINRFLDKNLILSELARLCEDYKSTIIEASNNTSYDDDPIYNMDKVIADDFIDMIKDLVPEKAIKLIRDRVADSMDQFLNQQAENKASLMSIYNKANEKVNKASSEAVKEDVTNLAKLETTKIYNRPTDVLGAMVRIMAENALKDEKLKKVYYEGAQLNMKQVVNDSAVVYMVLETLNTLSMVDMDENYIKKTLSESRM